MEGMWDERERERMGGRRIEENQGLTHDNPSDTAEAL